MKQIFNGEDIRVILSRNLKRLREIHHLSQMALADETNLTHNFIHDLEGGKKWISAETLGKIASVFEVDPYQLFLPETAGEDPGNIFSMYLNDFSDNLQRMVGELKTRYLEDLDTKD